MQETSIGMSSSGRWSILSVILLFFRARGLSDGYWPGQSRFIGINIVSFFFGYTDIHEANSGIMKE